MGRGGGKERGPGGVTRPNFFQSTFFSTEVMDEP